MFKKIEQNQINAHIMNIINIINIINIKNIIINT